MSLPPFLFSSAAPTAARSAFASTTANGGMSGVEMGSGSGSELDFRQAFMQAAQTKTPSELKAVTTDGEEGGSLIAELNLLFGSDALPEELQESLQSLLGDIQQGAAPDEGVIETIAQYLHQAELPEEHLELAISALEGVVAEMSLKTQQPVEAVAALQELVDLLTAGKTLPPNLSADVMNLSDSEAGVAAEVPLDTEMSAVIPYLTKPLQSAVPPIVEGSVMPAEAPDVLLAEQAKPSSGIQWQLDADDDAAGGQMLKPELFTGSKTTGVAADLVVKPEPAASPFTAILSQDVEVPESFTQHAVATTPVGKTAVPASLQAPTDPQLNANMRVQVAFGHAQWSEALAERTAWLAGQQIHSAELHLDPPELGPLQVRISVHQDQAVVNFVSANPQVRDALDQSMTRLRELLQEQGMQLVDAGVSDQRGGKGDTAGGEGAERLSGNGSGEDTAEQAQTLGAVIDTRYGVDDFV